MFQYHFRGKISSHSNILVCLDSNHTKTHVKSELDLYYEFVTAGSYLIVFDTVIESLPEECCKDREWAKENNPLTAVNEWIVKNKLFKSIIFMIINLLLALQKVVY